MILREEGRQLKGYWRWEEVMERIGMDDVSIGVSREEEIFESSTDFARLGSGQLDSGFSRLRF